jgi:hypothetical protein
MVLGAGAEQEIVLKFYCERSAKDSVAIPGHVSEGAQPVLRAEVGTLNELRRILGTWDLVLMIIGTVIGSGIFLVPGLILRAVNNSVPSSLGVWLAGGMPSLLGALTFGELMSRRPGKLKRRAQGIPAHA